ncbi:hypothetical protein PRUB_a5377 [Pseudoalteromonas rubra]|uniref:HEAT repeat domain-containing protein n=1 Tax=Pseudoalteromonas rubra TaxID=43658 RepID=A0A8T0CEB7_9GAMM|nr:hypothetical protein [Pseudoalteromonas rubra]KAF7789053.1 hypothetical protein PRUB_a5377 [Pseudoalteromonas rubra]
MTLRYPLKHILISLTAIALVAAVFLVHTLGGLNSQPVVYAEPPAFVERYATAINNSTAPIPSVPAKPKSNDTDHTVLTKWMEGFTYEETLAFKAIMTGETLDEFLRLFSHPDKAQRIKVASAFAAVQIKYTHNEESGYPKKRNQFMADKSLTAHFPVIRNALAEALIATAKEGIPTRIPYTLAWLTGQGQETIELFTWSAQHHPDHNVRRSSIYYVSILNGGENVAGPLLQSRIHDPVYSVRKLALDLRFRKLIGDI